MQHLKEVLFEAIYELWSWPCPFALENMKKWEEHAATLQGLLWATTCLISDARLAIISDYEDYCDLFVMFPRLLIKFPSGSGNTKAHGKILPLKHPLAPSCDEVSEDVIPGMKDYTRVLIRQKWGNIELQVGFMPFSLRDADVRTFMCKRGANGYSALV